MQVQWISFHVVHVGLVCVCLDGGDVEGVGLRKHGARTDGNAPTASLLPRTLDPGTVKIMVKTAIVCLEQIYIDFKTAVYKMSFISLLTVKDIKSYNRKGSICSVCMRYTGKQAHRHTQD